MKKIKISLMALAFVVAAGLALTTQASQGIDPCPNDEVPKDCVYDGAPCCQTLDGTIHKFEP